VNSVRVVVRFKTSFIDQNPFQRIALLTEKFRFPPRALRWFITPRAVASHIIRARTTRAHVTHPQPHRERSLPMTKTTGKVRPGIIASRDALATRRPTAPSRVIYHRINLFFPAPPVTQRTDPRRPRSSRAGEVVQHPERVRVHHP
jgi:hypothetical protein